MVMEEIQTWGYILCTDPLRKGYETKGNINTIHTHIHLHIPLHIIQTYGQYFSDMSQNMTIKIGATDNDGAGNMGASRPVVIGNE